MCEPCGDTPEDNVTVFLVGADQKDQELRRAVFGKGISAAQTVFYCPVQFHGHHIQRKYVIIRICQQLYFSDTLFS